jgi:hypothetical protein
VPFVCFVGRKTAFQTVSQLPPNFRLRVNRVIKQEKRQSV